MTRIAQLASKLIRVIGRSLVAPPTYYGVPFGLRALWPVPFRQTDHGRGRTRADR
jgi:hypothetical protein